MIKPTVYTIPANQSFLNTLAVGIYKKYAKTTESLLTVTIFLPTRRACRSLNESFLDVEDNSKFIDKIIILRSLRYQNQFINYSFLNNYKNLIYVGTIDEYKDLKKDLNNLDFYECKDFLDMAMIIKSCKIFIGNSSLGFDIAEALKVPRLLEASPYFPARQVHGENGFDFYFQSHFENYFNILFNKINN